LDTPSYITNVRVLWSGCADILPFYFTVVSALRMRGEEIGITRKGKILSPDIYIGRSVSGIFWGTHIALTGPLDF